MKKTLMIFALATLFAACSPVEFDTFGNITGVVICDNEQGDPVCNVQVTLSPSQVSKFTDSAGKFEFIELDADHYELQIWKEGYKPDKIPVDVYAGETTEIKLVIKKNQE